MCNAECRPRHRGIPGTASSSARLRRWLATSALVCAGLTGGSLVATAPESGAATSGWYVASVPGTGADDVILGTTCANAGMCLAVGVSLINLGSNTPSFDPVVEQWDGASWSLQPRPPVPGADGGGFFSVSCVAGTDCWAVGTIIDQTGSGNPTGTLIEHWDGTSWSIVPSPDPTGTGVVGGILQSVSCTSPASCMAVGNTVDGNGTNLSQLIEHWDGTAWNIVTGGSTGQPYDQLSRVQCLSASDCWAVGNDGPYQQSPSFLPIFPGAPPGYPGPTWDQGLIEHWDGASWTVVPSVAESSPAGGYLSGIECVSDADCWASGAVTGTNGDVAGILMEHWDGGSWSDASAGVPVPPTTAGAIVSDVSCVGASQCWAVGSVGPFGGNQGQDFRPKGFVEYWNGSAWSIEPSPDVSPVNFLYSLTCLQGVGCTAVGSAAADIGNGGDPGLRANVEQMAFPPSSSQGLVLSAWDGGVFAFGSAGFFGSMGGQHLRLPVVGVAETPDGEGYWLVGSDGGVFAFGDAEFFGSMGGRHLDAPVVGIAATPDGGGYWLVAADGGVFAFGDARFAGSMGGHSLDAPVVGMTAAGGGGYWLVAADGGVFSFGGAPFAGSAGGLRLAAPVTGMAATPDGRGYWLAGSDGGVLTYGDAPFEGSVPAQGIVGHPPVVGIARTPTGGGYWLAGAGGAVYAYGDAAFLGAPDGRALARPLSGIASS